MDNSLDIFDNFNLPGVTAPETIINTPWQEDPRLKLLSYSSRNTLHSCPRKWLLNRLQSKQESDEVIDYDKLEIKNITFAYGHAYGTGVQMLFAGSTLDQVYWETFLNWPLDLEDADEKKKKSYFYAMMALEITAGLLTSQLSKLSNYELAYFDDKPAMELPYKIHIDGYWNRGKVDCVLKNKRTGKYAILEVKTTGAYTIDEANYANSGQALDYQVVLDSLVKANIEYEVIYLVYASSQLRAYEFVFHKDAAAKAEGLETLMMDVQFVKNGVFPKNGNSCMTYNTRCPHYGSCNSNPDIIKQPLYQSTLDTMEQDLASYTFTFDIKDLINHQLEQL